MAWWEYPTNFSNGTVVSGPADLFVKYPGVILNDYYGMGIVMLIWVVSFAMSMAIGTRKALSVSSFIAFIFSVYFINLGAINVIVSIVLIVLAAVGLLGSKNDGGGF
jgi:succinate-acetate transporter protein